MNAVRCNKCFTIIESKTVHDYQTCLCGHVSVDGGNNYKKRGFHGEPDFTELDHGLVDEKIAEQK